MNLQELVAAHGQRPQRSVPDWMLGFFKRYAISFADGTTDLDTHVCWLQSRNFTIDLRLPLAADQAPPKPLWACTTADLQRLADHEGWAAESEWDGRVLRWHDTEASLQLLNRWPEPAILHRVGNCMVEFCASGAYVEDWRLQPSRPGPLVGLRLTEEREVASGRLRHRGGGLIVCGEHAALVRGRPAPVAAAAGKHLKALVEAAEGDLPRLQRLFDFETSVARGSLAEGYAVVHSTQPLRVGQPLLALDGFDFLPGDGNAPAGVRQRTVVDGVAVERHFGIDTLEARVDFPQATGITPEAADWYRREAGTLGRYTRVLA